MQKLLLLLVFIAPLYAATLLHTSNFEDANWKPDFLNATYGWNTYTPNGIQRVTNLPHSGSYCVRGNWRTTLVDPISGAQTRGDIVSQFNWCPKNAAGKFRLAAQLESTGKAFLRYWYRIDKFNWAGSNIIGVKFCYIPDTVLGTAAYTITIDGFADNSAYATWHNTSPYPWGPYFSTGGRTKLYFPTLAPEFACDGEWKKVEVFFDFTGPTHYMKMWLNGRLLTWNFVPGMDVGNIPVHPNYMPRGIQFFNASNQCFDLSTNTTAGNYSAGYQIDDIELYDDTAGVVVPLFSENQAAQIMSVPSAMMPPITESNIQSQVYANWVLFGYNDTFPSPISDSVVSAYPRTVRADAQSTVAQRTITVKTVGSYKPSSQTVVNLGALSLGKSKSFTDSTVTDTVPITVARGYYKAWLSDVSWGSVYSDTLINALYILKSKIIVTNPR